MEQFFSIDGISDEVCAAINRGLGITGIPTVDASDHIIDSVGVAGAEAFCARWGAQPEQQSYFQVLIVN